MGKRQKHVWLIHFQLICCKISHTKSSFGWYIYIKEKEKRSDLHLQEARLTHFWLKHIWLYTYVPWEIDGPSSALGSYSVQRAQAGFVFLYSVQSLLMIYWGCSTYKLSLTGDDKAQSLPLIVWRERERVCVCVCVFVPLRKTVSDWSILKTAKALGYLGNVSMVQN